MYHRSNHATAMDDSISPFLQLIYGLIINAGPVFRAITCYRAPSDTMLTYHIMRLNHTAGFQ